MSFRDKLKNEQRINADDVANMIDELVESIHILAMDQQSIGTDLIEDTLLKEIKRLYQIIDRINPEQFKIIYLDEIGVI